jgi:uncharacterized membrane-anchored protein
MRNSTSMTLAVVAVLAASAPAQAKAKPQPRHKPAPGAQETPAPAADEQPAAQAERKGPRPLLGPQKIELGDDLVLDLPADMAFFEHAGAKEIMEASGNVVGDDLRGLVVKRDSKWWVTVRYVGDGYVKDNDAADFKPDEILENIREGTEQENEYRQQRGFSAMHVDGWTEPPRYERAQHHLIWGIKGSDAEGSSINFYTRVLGRRGYVALNLIDDPGRIEASKGEALAVLRATTFKPGARYEDYDKSKGDKVAEYGLAALVAGGAGAAALKLAKVGLLAKFGGKLIALLIAGKKVVVGLFLALGAGLKSLFGRRRRRDEMAAAAPPASPPAEGPPAQPPSEGPPAP